MIPPCPAQAAALAKMAKLKPGVVVKGADGVQRSITMDVLHRKSARHALVQQVSKLALDEDDEVMGLMKQVRQRFDNAGVPMHDVQLRFRNLCVTGLAAKVEPPPANPLVRVAQVRRGPRCLYSLRCPYLRLAMGCPWGTAWPLGVPQVADVLPCRCVHAAPAACRQRQAHQQHAQSAHPGRHLLCAQAGPPHAAAGPSRQRQVHLHEGPLRAAEAGQGAQGACAGRGLGRCTAAWLPGCPGTGTWQPQLAAARGTCSGPPFWSTAWPPAPLLAPSLQVRADELTYNGLSFGEFVVERSAAYINQDDIHFGELTVTETLSFAALCQTSRTRKRERQPRPAASPRALPARLPACLPARCSARPGGASACWSSLQLCIFPHWPRVFAMCSLPEAIETILEEKERELGIIPDPAVATYMHAKGEHHRLAADIAIKALGLEGCANTLVVRGLRAGLHLAACCWAWPCRARHAGEPQVGWRLGHAG